MKRWYRSGTNRMISGLCGGIGEALGMSAALVRLVAVVAAICSFGITAFLYIVGSLLLPKRSATGWHS